MKIILEPADTAGQKQVALGLQASGLAEVIELDFGGNGGRRLYFNFEDEARKKDVMVYFVEMHAKGLILHTKKDLVRFLAAATNLGSIAAIRQLYYRCQREYVRK